ncbi:unnamed protein product [Camellia sinensis]
MVRDELEQLLDDDDDMADLYLSRKLAGASSPVSGSGAANWFPMSPTIGSKISRASRASVARVRGDEDDVEELEMLLEAYFMQIYGTLNKLTMLREYIDDTEDYINIQLDNHRNQLIQGHFVPSFLYLSFPMLITRVLLDHEIHKLCPVGIGFFELQIAELQQHCYCSRFTETTQNFNNLIGPFGVRNTEL